MTSPFFLLGRFPNAVPLDWDTPSLLKRVNYISFLFHDLQGPPFFHLFSVFPVLEPTVDVGPVGASDAASTLLFCYVDLRAKSSVLIMECYAPSIVLLRDCQLSS